MDRFDPTILERELVEDDYVPRRGGAHLMVWGRGHQERQLVELGVRWGVGLFVLGHEYAPEGALAVAPNAVVLNSDHERGAYLQVGDEAGLDGPTAAAAARTLARA